MIRPPMTTVASGRWISAPGVVAVAIGMKPKPATRAVIRIGRSRTRAASRAAAWASTPSWSEVLDGADPDQAVEDGHAEQGDEPDARRDRERQAARGQGEDAAGRRHRHGQVDQGRQAERVEACCRAAGRSRPGRSARRSGAAAWRSAGARTGRPSGGCSRGAA